MPARFWAVAEGGRRRRRSLGGGVLVGGVVWGGGVVRLTGRRRRGRPLCFWLGGLCGIRKRRRVCCSSWLLCRVVV